MLPELTLSNFLTRSVRDIAGFILLLRSDETLLERSLRFSSGVDGVENDLESEIVLASFINKILNYSIHRLELCKTYTQFFT